MRTRNQNQKRQTHLSFNPLPSSSPSAKTYPEGIQNQLANVSYETPFKRRKKMEEPGLPTPVASSQRKEQNLDQDADSPVTVVDVTSAPSTPSTPTRSGGIDATNSDHGVTPVPTLPHQTSSPNEEAVETSDEEGIVPSVRARRPKAVWESDSESDDESDVLPPTRRSKKGKGVQESSPELENVQFKSPGTRRSTRGKAAQQSSPTQSLKNVQIKSSPRHRTRSATKQTSKEMLRSHKKTLTPQKPLEVQNPDSSDIGEAESSDDDDLTVPGGQPKSKRVHQAQHSTGEVGMFIVDDSEESDIQVSPSKRRKISPRKYQSLSPAKRGSDSPMKLSRPSSRQEQEDLAEDLEDLQDTVVRESRTRRPSRNVNKQAQKEALKQIRRKHREKAGETVSEDEDDDDEDGTADGDGDEDSELETVSDSQAYLGNLDEYEEDFIDNAEEGAAEHRPLPLELSNFSIQKPKELFKYVVDWLVHNKLNPAFPRHDPKYHIAFDKLNQEAEGLAGQSTSSAWGPHPAGIKFTKALKARPEIHITNYDHRLLSRDCDACNRSRHPASFEIVFDGKCYDRRTLEDKDEEDTSFEEDDPAVDVVGPEVTFYVGSHCKANAEKVHNLTHWKYHVNGWIVDHLKANGEFSDAKILKRSKWNSKKLTREADDIVDEMEEQGVVDELYKHLRLHIKEARAPQPDRFANYYE